MNMSKLEIDEADNCLPFVYDLPESTLLLVSNEYELDRTKAILANASILGIDSETKPNFNKYQKKNPTALLQIAVRGRDGAECVILFDLLRLSSKSGKEKLSAVLEDVFKDSSILKIGQGLDDDFNELKLSYPDCLCFHSINSIVETNTMYRYLNTEEKQLVSLKRLVRLYLHSNLVKTEQRSNWARRPLSKKQIFYAACDALVLLRLYDVMSCEISDTFKIANNTFDVKSILLDFPKCLNTHKCGIRKGKTPSEPPSPMNSSSTALSCGSKISPSYTDRKICYGNDVLLANNGSLESLNRKRFLIEFEDDTITNDQDKNSISRTVVTIPVKDPLNEPSSKRKRCQGLASLDPNLVPWKPIHSSVRKSNAIAIGSVAQRFASMQTKCSAKARPSHSKR